MDEKKLTIYFTSDLHGYIYPTDYRGQGEKELGLFKCASRFRKDGNTLVIDGGDTRLGLESTVIDMTGEHPVLLRPGGLPKEAVEAALNMEVLLPQDQKIIRRSPGTRYRHYAPSIPLRLTAPHAIPVEAENWAWLGTKIPNGAPRIKIIFKDDAEYAKELFRALRTLEKSGAQIIYAELPEENGIGRALKDRLTRAAGG